MRKVIVVAVREYQAAVKTKAFLITLLAMPLLMGGSIGVQVLMRDKVDTRDKKMKIVDHSGVLFESIAAAAKEYNENEIYAVQEEGPRRQVKPRFVVERAEGVAQDNDKADLALSDEVREGDVLAYVVIGPKVVNPNADPSKAYVHYHSNSPTYFDFIRWVATPINDRVRQLRCRQAGLDPAVVETVTKPVSVQNLGLVTIDETGQIKPAEETNRFANMLMPLGILMLMFMVVLVSASPLMQSVLEEKMQRIAEVLLASVSPFKLMLGKLLGIVGVSLTLATLYLVGGFLAMWWTGYEGFFPAHVVWWFVAFQSLAVLMFGSMFIAIGAAVTDIKESQSMMMPVTILIAAPMFFWANVVQEPTSMFSTILSLIPPFTPAVMILRQSVPPGVPLWQPILGILLVLIMTIICVYAAGRIFRVGILIQGKGASFGDMMRWAIRG